MYVDEERDQDHPVRKFVTKPFLYNVGSHMGCGCPFGSEPELRNPTEEDLLDRRDFRLSVDYVRAALGSCRTVEFYGGWDYWEPPLERRTIAVEEILRDNFFFDERELISVNSP